MIKAARRSYSKLQAESGSSMTTTWSCQLRQVICKFKSAKITKKTMPPGPEENKIRASEEQEQNRRSLLRSAKVSWRHCKRNASTCQGLANFTENSANVIRSYNRRRKNMKIILSSSIMYCCQCSRGLCTWGNGNNDIHTEYAGAGFGYDGRLLPPETGTYNMRCDNAEITEGNFSG